MNVDRMSKNTSFIAKKNTQRTTLNIHFKTSQYAKTREINLIVYVVHKICILATFASILQKRKNCIKSAYFTRIRIRSLIVESVILTYYILGNISIHVCPINVVFNLFPWKLRDSDNIVVWWNKTHICFILKTS